MNDPQVRALERDRQRVQEVTHISELVTPRRTARIEVPVIAVLALPTQDIQLVIPEHDLREIPRTQIPHEPQHPRTVGPPVAQIANKHEPPPMTMLTMTVIPETQQQ